MANAGAPPASNAAVAGEDCGAVTELVIVDECETLFVGVDADHCEYWPEDLVEVHLHVWLDVVDQADADKEAVLVELLVAAVDDDGCSICLSASYV